MVEGDIGINFIFNSRLCVDIYIYSCRIFIFFHFGWLLFTFKPKYQILFYLSFLKFGHS